MLAAPAVQADEAAEMTRGEQKLAKMLEGRVAGEPQNCIRTIGSRSLTSIDDTALVYRDGKTVWVNYTRTPDAIDDGDYLVIKKFSATSLCRTDQIQTYDRAGDFFSGVIMLDDFVPYRIVEEG
ncbi:hypothetical protein GRI69_12210 [Erythrobacter vulgaris]|uniref:Uncharacterized protein n=2 Tax=Qipengyuania vulgaris TaxID=291985 RepID=A0A844XVN7_9SPHN|nr:hypothetical protein [Qipengyuania vulgaris]